MGSRSNSSSDLKGFAARLRTAMAGESVRTFASKTTVAEGTLRKYLAGTSDPSRSALISLARAAHVRLDWLATGDGPITGAETGPLDRDLLVEIATRDELARAAVRVNERVLQVRDAVRLLLEEVEASTARKAVREAHHKVKAQLEADADDLFKKLLETMRAIADQDQGGSSRAPDDPRVAGIRNRVRVQTAQLGDRYNHVVGLPPEERMRAVDEFALGQITALAEQREAQRDP